MKAQFGSAILLAVILAVSAGAAAYAQTSPAAGAGKTPSSEASRATSGAAPAQPGDRSPVGTISRADKAGPAVVGPDGSPPVPRVQGEPHRRCLAPYPICP